METLEVEYKNDKGNKREFIAEVWNKSGGRTLIFLSQKNGVHAVRRNVITDNFKEHKDQYLGFMIQDYIDLENKIR